MVATNLSSSTATEPNKVAYPMLKHLRRSGIDLFLHIFNLSWSSHSFPSIERHLPLFSFIRWKSLSTLLLPFDLSLSPPVSQSYLNASFYHVYFSFRSLISFSLHARPVSALDSLLWIKFCTFLSPWMGLTNPGRALGLLSLLSTSSKLLTLSGIPPFSTNSFRLASLLALLVGLNLSFLIGALAWFIKITKAVPFESVEVFRKDPFLALYFSLSSSMILPACLPCSVLVSSCTGVFGFLFFWIRTLNKDILGWS